MYNQLSTDYDRFVNWNARLEGEMPFLKTQFAALAPGRSLDLLDAACGTGMHAIALARLGHRVAGADLSTGMIEQARHNAAQAGVSVRFETTGFGSLAPTFGKSSFDGLLCLGNSLPHVLTPGELAATLADFAECLRPGGRLIIQNRNFDAVMANRARWMDPQSHRETNGEWIFIRFYDFEPDGLITFNMLVLQRSGAGPWDQRITSSRLRPMLRDETLAALAAAGYGRIQVYGSLGGAPFDPILSGNLVIVADRET